MNFSTSPSGTASARLFFAADPTCSSRAVTYDRWIAISQSFTTSSCAELPDGCVLDGEIVIATPHGLDFDALQLRLHPAASRAAKLSKESPSSFVAFDLLATGRSPTFATRRRRGVGSCSNRRLAQVEPPIHLTPLTRDAALAAEWLLSIRGRRASMA